MNEDLKNRLDIGEKPFNEKTITVDDWIPISLLLEVTTTIFRHIRQYYPNNVFYFFDDWHFHDGFISSSKKISYDKIESILESENTFYKSRHKDFEVFKAFYPDSYDFLLRYYILDEDDDPQFYPGIWGSFSFTGYGNDMLEVRKCLSAHRDAPLIEKNSIEYFESNYGG